MSVRRRASGRAHYNYFRDYDPAVGRYVQSDPIGITPSVNDPGLRASLSMLVGFDSDLLPEQNLSYAYVNGNPLVVLDPEGLAGKGGRGITGGSSGKGTPNPYKHCVTDPENANFILCKDKTTGKKIRKPKVADFPANKMDECDGTCDTVARGALAVGAGYLVYRCVRFIPSLLPPLWWTLPGNLAAP